jgi:hypothetical protein
MVEKCSGVARACSQARRGKRSTTVDVVDVCGTVTGLCALRHHSHAMPPYLRLVLPRAHLVQPPLAFCSQCIERLSCGNRGDVSSLLCRCLEHTRQVIVQDLSMTLRGRQIHQTCIRPILYRLLNHNVSWLGSSTLITYSLSIVTLRTALSQKSPLSESLLQYCTLL